MKKENAKPYPELGKGKWTVRRIDGYNGGFYRYQAYNVATGDYGKLRDYYDQALKDIPESTYAEPWGV
jgi:hypothetical protein